MLNGQFVDIMANLIQSNGNKMYWVDIDNDNDLDINIAGNLYRNDNGLFTQTQTTDSYFGIWYDYDSNGYVDFLQENIYPPNVKLNNQGSLTTVQPLFPSLTSCETFVTGAWGDVNNDCSVDYIALIRYDDQNFHDSYIRCYGQTGENIYIEIPNYTYWGVYINNGTLSRQAHRHAFELQFPKVKITLRA